MDAKPDEKKKTGAMEPRTQHVEEKRRPGTTTEETSTEKVTVLYLHQQSAWLQKLVLCPHAHSLLLSTYKRLHILDALRFANLCQRVALEHTVPNKAMPKPTTGPRGCAEHVDKTNGVTKVVETESWSYGALKRWRCVLARTI